MGGDRTGEEGKGGEGRERGKRRDEEGRGGGGSGKREGYAPLTKIPGSTPVADWEWFTCTFFLSMLPDSCCQKHSRM